MEHLSTGEMSMVPTEEHTHFTAMSKYQSMKHFLIFFFFLHLPLIRNEWKPLELGLGKLKNAALILM